MNAPKMACNYAIIRFLPYIETEEFVNVGLVLACPTAQFFGFRLETQRSRVNGFFPELNKNIFVQGRTHFRAEMERVRLFLDRTSNDGVLTFAAQEFNRAFLDVVKQRESIFRFSGVGTRLADDPEEALDQLFEYYVERQFAQRKEYQETEMVNQLRGDLRRAKILGYRSGRVGNERYEVHFPLLRRHEGAQGEFRAIKPLDLAKKDPTDITVHADEWLAKINHLKKMEVDLNRVLFAVQMPRESLTNLQVAEEMFGLIQASGVRVTHVDETGIISDFARAV